MRVVWLAELVATSGKQEDEGESNIILKDQIVAAIRFAIFQCEFQVEM